MTPIIAIGLLLTVLAGVTAYKTAKVVPEQNVYIIERLGSYHRTLDAGLNFLIPFIDKVAYKLSLKEEAIDIAEQSCITRDNVMVGVDGVIYIKVLEPRLASYEISDYFFAVTQLTQTTLRSEIGKLELDKTFEARQVINASVVQEVDKASEVWGVKVLRYEIRNINPPREVISAMEKQMRAEREKRAAILQSEGEREAKINVAEGAKQAYIKDSEGKALAQVNRAKGEAEAILEIAEATAAGLKVLAEQLQSEGGRSAMEMRLAEQFIPEFGKIAQVGNTIVLPANLTDLGSMISMAKGILKPEQVYVAQGQEAVKPKWT